MILEGGRGDGEEAEQSAELISRRGAPGSGRERGISPIPRSEAGNYIYVTHTAIIPTSSLIISLRLGREFSRGSSACEGKRCQFGLHPKALPSSPLGDAVVERWWAYGILGCISATLIVGGPASLSSFSFLWGVPCTFTLRRTICCIRVPPLIHYPFQSLSIHTFWPNYVVFKGFPTTSLFLIHLFVLTILTPFHGNTDFLCE